MPDISLITSLYRSDTHLPTYITAVQHVIAQSDLTVEIVVVANDATDVEQRLLTDFSQQSSYVQVLYCPRETLYASWNRGIAAAKSNIMGFWNVDDIRTVEGLQVGYDALTETYDIVDFAFMMHTPDSTTHVPVNYQPTHRVPKAGIGPFFMFHRDLYAQAGPFNPHFRITGDFEWCIRDTVRNAAVLLSDTVGGTFLLHGDNLSGGTHPHEWVEFNIALLIHGVYGALRPVDPTLFRQVWAEWGDAAPFAPAQLLTWLTDEETAAARFRDYQRYKNASSWQQRYQTWLARLTLQATPVSRFHPPPITPPH